MSSLNRRRFLQRAASSAALGVPSRTAAQGVPVVIDLADPVASAGPARWAARELEQALAANPKAGNRSIIAAGSKNPVAREILKQAGVSIPEVPESLGIVPGKMAGKPVLLASGFDTRGLVDRLPAIDADIELMEKQVASGNAPQDQVARIGAIRGQPQRASLPCRHQPAPNFNAGQPLEIELAIRRGSKPLFVRLYYRHVTQAERYKSADMLLSGERYRIAIPGSYTDSAYPLEYYFEVQHGRDSASLYPGFQPELNNQPYFVVRPG